jgi:hypothetical protein
LSKAGPFNADWSAIAKRVRRCWGVERGKEGACQRSQAFRIIDAVFRGQHNASDERPGRVGTEGDTCGSILVLVVECLI